MAAPLGLFRWTDENMAIAERLYREGRTAREVAAAIGTPSRSAIIGKAHRSGWKAGVNPEREAAAQAALAMRRRLEARRRMSVSANGRNAVEVGPDRSLPKLRAVQTDTPPRLLTDLKFCQCRWPVSDPPKGRADEMLFCAAPTGEGATYCGSHAAIAYQAPPPGSRMAAAQSAFRGVADVMATRIDELRLLGNGVSDAQGALAIRDIVHALAARSPGAARLVRRMRQPA